MVCVKIDAECKEVALLEVAAIQDGRIQTFSPLNTQGERKLKNSTCPLGKQ